MATVALIPGAGGAAWYWHRARAPEAKIAFTKPAAFQTWPDVPIHVAIGMEDRFFPAEFQAARKRLGSSVRSIDELPGGHLIALSHPHELACLLLAYLAGRSKRRDEHAHPLR